MSNKKRLSIPWIIIAIIVGGALYKQFDATSMTFENPALSVIYALTFLMTLYFIFKKD